MIPVKTPEEIEIMRQAGKILAGAFKLAGPMMIPGQDAGDIDRAVEEYIRAHDAVPIFKNYPNAEGKPFPASICLSIDAEVVHGIPDHRILEEGTIVGLDIGLRYRGYCADSAYSYAIGAVDQLRRTLLDVTRRALELGIAEAKEGERLSNIGYAVQSFVESHGFNVVRDLVGHGIGRNLHEEPQVPNYGPPYKGPVLRRNMTLAIEPMVNAGSAEVDMIGDWDVLTRDRKPSAHYEHTVVITNGQAEILTA